MQCFPYSFIRVSEAFLADFRTQGSQQGAIGYWNVSQPRNPHGKKEVSRLPLRNLTCNFNKTWGICIIDFDHGFL